MTTPNFLEAACRDALTLPQMGGRNGFQRSNGQNARQNAQYLEEFRVFPLRWESLLSKSINIH